jgi:hypothetical protein
MIRTLEQFERKYGQQIAVVVVLIIIAYLLIKQ